MIPRTPDSRRAAGPPGAGRVDVDDIDAALAKITALGGSTFREKMEVPGMGWNAYFKDSEGNLVGLWQNAARD